MEILHSFCVFSMILTHKSKPDHALLKSSGWQPIIALINDKTMTKIILKANIDLVKCLTR